MKKNLIIDKFTLSRESLSSLVNRTIEDCIVHQANSFEHAKEIIEQNGEFDLLIYNPLHLDSENNEHIRQLKQLNPNSKLLVISHSRDENYIGDLIKNGADATVNINCTRHQICSQIRSLQSNNAFMSYQEVQSDVRLVNAVSETKTNNNNDCHFKLTNRQREVLDYVTKGYANKLIAYELGVSRRHGEAACVLHIASAQGD